MNISETERIKFEQMTNQWTRRDKAVFMMGQMSVLFHLDDLFSHAEPPDEAKREFIETMRQIFQVKAEQVRLRLRDV
jgi:hypothetical protein